MTDLETQVEHWKSEGYMLVHRGTLVLTEKFYNTLGQKPPPKAPTDNKDLFKEFLKQSEVPVKVPWGKGRPGGWNCGFYSLGAEKAFTRILKTPSLDYSRLVASTRQFYKGDGGKYTIQNYLEQGYWETAYDSYNNVSTLKPIGIEL